MGTPSSPFIDEINHEINHPLLGTIGKPPHAIYQCCFFDVGPWPKTLEGAPGRGKHPETDLKFGRFWRDFRNAESSNEKRCSHWKVQRKHHKTRGKRDVEDAGFFVYHLVI